MLPGANMLKFLGAILIALSLFSFGDGALARGGGHSSSHSYSGQSSTGYHSVGGYYRTNGTYVAPHFQTNPNGTKSDNWSTKGNVNPFTGQPGTKPLNAPTGH